MKQLTALLRDQGILSITVTVRPDLDDTCRPELQIRPRVSVLAATRDLAEALAVMHLLSWTYEQTTEPADDPSDPDALVTHWEWNGELDGVLVEISSNERSWPAPGGGA